MEHLGDAATDDRHSRRSTDQHDGVDLSGRNLASAIAQFASL